MHPTLILATVKFRNFIQTIHMVMLAPSTLLGIVGERIVSDATTLLFHTIVTNAGRPRLRVKEEN